VYLRDLIAALLRRWRFVVAGVVITAIICTGLGFLIPASYVAKTSLVLLPPVSVVGAGGNPFLFLGGLGQALDVLTENLGSDTVRERIEDAHPGAKFAVSADTSTTGPILVIQATATSADEALAVTQEVAAQAPVSMASLQSKLSVPERSRITMAEVAVDAEPDVDQKNRIQSIVAVAIVGLFATLLLAGYRDSRIASRRSQSVTATTPDRPPARTDL
jgi:uncharacterized protein involved in exopolysaccharide biosynthesis